MAKTSGKFFIKSSKGIREATEKEAIEALRRGEDTYTYAASDAKRIQKKSQGKGKVIQEDAHKPGYFDHYHDKERESGHSFYGDPRLE